MISRESLLMRLHTAEMELSYVYPAENLLECRLCKVKVEYTKTAIIPHTTECIFHGIRDGETTQSSKSD